MNYETWLDIKEFYEDLDLFTRINQIVFHTLYYLVKCGIKIQINDLDFNEFIKEILKEEIKVERA